MSIASELTRLKNAKNAISNAIKNKGVTVPTGTKLDGMAALIGHIKTGGSLQSKNATPTKKQQSITPDDGYFGLSDVTIAPIPDSYVQPTKTGTVTVNATYNVREYKSLTVNVASSGSSLPTSKLSAGSAIGGTMYYIDKNGQGQSSVGGGTVTSLKGSYFVLDWAGAADGYYLDGCEIVRAYGPVETTVGDGDEYYVMILKITGDSAYPMI